MESHKEWVWEMQGERESKVAGAVTSRYRGMILKFISVSE